MSASLLVTALLAGLAGGVHCAAMCGGFMTALAARDAQARRVLLPARRMMREQAAYHAGRLTTYMLLGAAFGAAGAASIGAIDLAPVQRGLYVVANMLLLAMAATLVTRRRAGGVLARAFLPLATRVLPALVRSTRDGGTTQRLLLGAGWGLVPCTLVYAMLPLALFAGGAWQGALVMLVFGAATLPNLLGIGFLLQRLRTVLRARALRTGAAAAMAAFAVAGLYRVAFVPGALAQGPFCFVP